MAEGEKQAVLRRMTRRVQTGRPATPPPGAQAVVEGRLVQIGRIDLVGPTSHSLSTPTHEGTTVWLGWQGRSYAALTVTDTIRPDAAEAISALASRGVTAYLLTGDHERAALPVATQIGIPAERVLADVRPEDKFALIEKLRVAGKVVAMVGDGVNDAAALAAADLGIAMGSGTDVAAETADIVLLRSELGAVVESIGLSRATLRTIRQNLAWAFGYNIAAIPLAVAGLLNPMIAGAAMAASSVLVVTNSLRLRRWRQH